MVQNYDATTQSVPIASPGATLGTDWEQRVDFARLRSDRARKVQDALASSEIGSLILFDMNNIRYTTATHIGNWARDKLFRCCLVMRGEQPILWDIGSAARTHQAFAPWNAKQNWRAGISSWRGSIPEEVGVERGMPGGWPGYCVITAWPASRSGWTWWSFRCCGRWRRRA